MAIAKNAGVVQPSAYFAALPLLYAAFEKRPTPYTGPQGMFGMTGLPGPARLSMATNKALAQQLYLQTKGFAQKIHAFRAMGIMAWFRWVSRESICFALVRAWCAVILQDILSDCTTA